MSFDPDQDPNADLHIGMPVHVQSAEKNFYCGFLDAVSTDAIYLQPIMPRSPNWKENNLTVVIPREGAVMTLLHARTVVQLPPIT